MAEIDRKIGVDYSQEDNKKDGKYAGAFVKQPIVGYYSGVSAFDFASLYPSVMRQFNISPDVYVDLIPKNQIAERRKNKEEIVCENGVVYKKEDSILKKILGDLYAQRKDYKKTSYEYYTKAEELRKLIKS